jgi:hypothetical protein
MAKGRHDAAEIAHIAMSRHALAGLAVRQLVNWLDQDKRAARHAQQFPQGRFLVPAIEF